MSDPEKLYTELTSGDAGAVRGHAGTLESTLTRLDGAADAIDEATGVPIWASPGALAFRLRAATLAGGVRANQAAVSRAASCLTLAASSYESMVTRADTLIGHWRRRPATLGPILESILRFLIVGQLRAAGSTHSQRLSALRAVASGDETDLDELDEDTREWVEDGMERTDAWLKENGSGLGPVIPHTAATGDDRGWTPQGLGYDPRTGVLLQSYYNDHGDPSSLSLIDETTGSELTNVNLGGGSYIGDDGQRHDFPSPGHVGGVTVSGDDVYVTNSHPPQLIRYSLADLRAADPGTTVSPAGAPIDVPAAEHASYTAVDDQGRLYVGDHGANTMYVYEKQGGEWVNTRTVPTPEDSQGVVVRDGEYVFSTSYGRDNGSSLVVQDRQTGDELDRYDLPNMSQGVVEIDGELVTTYESGAGKFDDINSYTGWLPGIADGDDLWAMRFMTRTPLSDLGLAEDLDVEPQTLRGAAGDLDDASTTVSRVATDVHSVKVQAHLFGEVPAAGPFSQAVNTVVSGCARSLGTGSTAVTTLADGLVGASRAYEASDAASGRDMDATNPGTE